MSSADKDRAERLFRQQQEAPKALAEYRAKEEATRTPTVKLRAERLARETHDKPSRHKGRIDPKEVEKAFPHIVQMIVPLGGFGKKLDEMYEWHWARDVEAMRGCGWRDDSGRFYIRWCFANLITAQDFARQFGGSIVMGR